MKLFENPMVHCDIMSFISLTQASAAMVDESLDQKQKQAVQHRMMLAGAIFCNVAIAFNESKVEHDGVEYPFRLTPSMATIGEPNSRDGAYVYITAQGGFKKLPEPDTREDDVICIYANFDVNNPSVEFYYGDLLMCSVSILTNDQIQVLPHMTMCDKDKLEDKWMESAYKIIEEGVQSAITTVHLNFMAGYKKGYEAAEKEIAEAIEEADNRYEDEED